MKMLEDYEILYTTDLAEEENDDGSESPFYLKITKEDSKFKDWVFLIDKIVSETLETQETQETQEEATDETEPPDGKLLIDYTIVDPPKDFDENDTNMTDEISECIGSCILNLIEIAIENQSLIVEPEEK